MEESLPLLFKTILHHDAFMLNIFVKIWYGSQIVWPFFLYLIRWVTFGAQKSQDSWAQMAKNLNKTGLLQWLFSSNAPPLVLFCIKTVPKKGHWLLKYNYRSRGSGLFAAKTFDFESSIEVLKELGSLYKMDQL